MAKVYKLTFYAVDPNDYYDNAFHLFSQMTGRENRSGVFFRAEESELITSEEFRWKDSCPLNYSDASKEDFEHYFQDKT